MARIRSEGTKPEERLGELLLKWLPDCLIIRNDPALPGKPDYHITDLGIVVFLDGCFFHGCPIHYREPEQNKEYWAGKVARNKVRDKLVTATLKALGFRVLRVWEHEVRSASLPGRERVRRRLRRMQKATNERKILVAAERSAPYSTKNSARE